MARSDRAPAYQAYLEQLDDEISDLDPTIRQEIVREAAAHLEDADEALSEGIADPDSRARQVLLLYGEAGSTARQLGTVHAGPTGRIQRLLAPGLLAALAAGHFATALALRAAYTDERATQTGLFDALYTHLYLALAGLAFLLALRQLIRVVRHPFRATDFQLFLSLFPLALLLAMAGAVAIASIPLLVAGLLGGIGWCLLIPLLRDLPGREVSEGKGDLNTRGGQRMSLPMASNRLWMSVRHGLTLFVLAVGALLFLPLYLFALLRAAWELGLPPALLSVVSFPFLPLAFFLMPMFSTPGFYLQAGLAVAGLALLALLLGHPGRHERLLLIAVLLAILAGPWVFRYQPAVAPAPGYSMVVATQPGPLEGIAKQAQAYLDIVPAKYTLLGWDAGEVLYYREESKGQPARLWAFAPALDREPREVANVPPGIIPDSPRESVIDWVRAPGSDLSFERSLRGIRVREAGMRSPTGRWVAAISQWTYGPEDVIVLSTE